MSTELIISNIPNILSIIAIFCGVVSIKIAKDSLIFNQRSMLIKESYEPILNDIKYNRKIKVHNSKELNFEHLKKIRDGYLFLAFEESDRNNINDLLEIEKEINQIKKKSDSLVENSIIKVLNDELQNQKNKEFIGYVNIGDRKGTSHNKNEENLYDIIFSMHLSYIIASNSPVIWCDIGHYYIARTPEGYQHESFNIENRITLSNVFKKYLGIEVNSYNLDEDYEIKKYENRIIKEIECTDDYRMLKKQYKELESAMDKLETEIIKKIKKLIIP